MFKKILSITLFSIISIPTASYSQVLDNINNTDRYTREGINFERVYRSYMIQSPESVEKKSDSNPKFNYKLDNAPEPNNEKYPLIIMYHAEYQSPSDIWSQTSLPEYSYHNNYFLVAPEAYKGIWNDGQNSKLNNERQKVDDVAFTMALIEKLQSNYPIDEKRVYVVGVSNGGFMATHLACRTNDVIAGGVNMLSTLTDNDSKTCSKQPIPWMSINAGSDKVVPYKGNIREAINGTPYLFSAEESFIFFSNKNKCLNTSGFNQLSAANNKDKTSAYIKTSTNCENNSTNVLLAFNLSGHQIPNFHSNKKPFEGLTTKHIDSGTAIINFFNNNMTKESK